MSSSEECGEEEAMASSCRSGAQGAKVVASSAMPASG
jgi:hypothetical protein